MITAVLKFEINNTFDEWEKGFYSHQSTARKAGLFEIYHGHPPDNERKICVVLNALSDAHMQKFMEANGEAMAATGHIMDSTVVEVFVN